jgi:hypothetical protein
LFIYKNYLVTSPRADSLQQEQFITYTTPLVNGVFPNGVSKGLSANFLGLPLLMWAVNLVVGNIWLAGYLITAFSLVIIYLFTVKLTKNPFWGFLVTIFPPIVFEQTSKMSTETVAIAISLVVYWLLSKKKYYWIAFLLGYGVILRPIMICPFIAILLIQLGRQKAFKIIKQLALFLIFPLLIVLFNSHYWGDPLYQLTVHVQLAGAVPVVIQLVKDIYRAIKISEFKIFYSGVSYVIFSVWLLWITLKKRGDYLFRGDRRFVFLATALTFVFIYSVGPIPILEEIRRFLAVFFPLTLIVNYRYFLNKKYLVYLFLGLSLFSFF